MVCLSNEGTIVATVRDTIGASSSKQATVTLAPSKLVSTLFEEVGKEFSYQPDAFELIIQNKTGDTVVLNNYKSKTLGEVKISFDQSDRNSLIVGALKNSKNMTLLVNDSNAEDDLSLGASASPTTGELPGGSNDPPPALMSIDDYPYFPSRSRIPPQIDTMATLDSCNYVGLVNQAMTCYLNSLLQTLYMTPEFRNALYNWEFDGQNKATSIPFQLQKLFLNLQTSTKSAVETTELTKSFGWDLSEAWQQHDIQELCRVMFDALEQKFKDTEQANLINALYEGKMLDYVKCLECGTEKSREDTFLDIPLPVRPFGSSVAYNSVEEALRAFVQPETLEGNNQYFCEKCNKKCDAHKGLKFIKFPYLLTLHLKRFDFDYSTMHRIKLNDKVVFPEVLNLNSFVANSNNSSENETAEERETTVKCDDSSTTDSGSALDDESCQGTDISSTINGPEDNCQEEDEGIDVSSGNNHESEKNRYQEAKGPYMYELFSIMIHSGSASGGHYYAYIKDFRRNQWFCFNDQAVTRITEDDIKKTYGGGPTRGYYSGAYSSSTNAYMLMYRQIDKERNKNAMTADEFPPHIKKLLQQMREKEDIDRAAKERENEMFRIKVYCWHPVHNQLIDSKIYCYVDTKLSEATKEAYHSLKLENTVPLEDCRLVTYNKIQESIECSFEVDLKFCDIPSMSMHHSDNWLLEVKQPGTEFQSYKPGGVTMKIFIVNLDVEEVEGSIGFRVHAGDCVRDVKMRLSKLLKININSIKLVLETYSNEPHYLDQDDALVKFDPNCSGYKLYVCNAPDEDSDKPFSESKLHKVIDRFVHVVTITATLPDTDISTLDSLSIPSLDLNQNSDKLDMAASGDRPNGLTNLRVSPQLGASAVCEAFGDQSNSEDSSLSDSDRTLVGEAPGDCIALLSSSSNSPADQHMSSPNDPTEDLYSHEIFSHPTEEMNWDDEETPDVLQFSANYYFKAIVMTNTNPAAELYNEADARWCKIQVDKRMTLARFKKNMEPVVGVPVEYFKIFRQYPNEVEWSRLSDTLSSLKDGDRLTLKLGRVLKKDEFGGKVYRLTPENSEPFDFLFEWVVAKGQTVGSVKKEILIAAKKQHMLDINYHKCRLRKKNWKMPSKVYLDEQKFVEDIPITNNWEMFLQDLGEPEKVKNSDQLCLFVKRWCPATLTLTPFHEIVLDSSTMDELKTKLAEESQIPKEYIEVAHPKLNFPCDMNVLDIHTELEWNPDVVLLEKWPVQVNEDGNVFYYRDSRETLKEITQEERNEINKRENARLGKFSTKSYSPRRERALKIYLDPTNKLEEPCVD